MEAWARRIKKLLDEGQSRGLSDSGLAAACGRAKPSIHQWFNDTPSKAASKMILGDNLVAAARYLGTSAEWIMTGKGVRDVSQGLAIDPDTMAHAFVAAEKAMRKIGLEYDAAQVPDILLFAYKERLEFPPGNDKAILAAYDRVVQAELERGRFNVRQADRSADQSDGGKAAQTAANRPKTRGGGR